MGATFSSENENNGNVATIGTNVIPTNANNNSQMQPDTQSQDSKTNPNVPMLESTPNDSRDGAPAPRGRADKKKSKDTFVNVLTGDDVVANTIIIMFIVICVLLSLCMVAGWVCKHKEQSQSLQTSNMFNRFQRQQRMQNLVSTVESETTQPPMPQSVGSGEYSSDLSF